MVDGTDPGELEGRVEVSLDEAHSSLGKQPKGRWIPNLDGDFETMWQGSDWNCVQGMVKRGDLERLMSGVERMHEEKY